MYQECLKKFFEERFIRVMRLELGMKIWDTYVESNFSDELVRFMNDGASRGGGEWTINDKLAARR